MKKIVILLITILLLFSIVGCDKVEKEIELENIEKIVDEKIVEIEFTYDDATNVFEKNMETMEHEIIDSILVDDKSNQIQAIILFDDKKNNNSCNLAFLVENMDKEYVVQVINFAVNEIEGVRDFEVVDGSYLTYKENGAVTLLMRKMETNEIFDFTIIYSYQEPDSTKFKIISNKYTGEI